MPKKDDFYDINDDAFIEEFRKLAEHEEQFSKIIEILKSCFDDTDVPETNAKLFCRAFAARLEAKRGELDKYSYYIGDKKYSFAYFLRRLDKMFTPEQKQMLALFYAKDTRISEIAKLTGKTQSWVYKKFSTAAKKLFMLGYQGVYWNIAKATVRRTLEKMYEKTPEGVTLYGKDKVENDADKFTNSVLIEDKAPEYVRADLVVSKLAAWRKVSTFGVGARKMIKGKNLGGYITVSHYGDTDSVNNDRIELCADISKGIDLFSKKGLIIQSEMRRLAKYPFAENRFLGTGSVIPASAEYRKSFGYSHYVLSECDTETLADGDIVREMRLIPIYSDEYEAMSAKLPISAARFIYNISNRYDANYPAYAYIPLDEKREHIDKKIYKDEE